MDINCRFIKISGKYEISQELQLGDNFHLEADFDVVSLQELDKQDGTKDIIYILKAPNLTEANEEDGPPETE